MPNKIKPRRSYTANSVPLTTDLEPHELAINWVDGKAFTKDASGNIVSVTLGGSGGGGGGGGGGSLSGSVTIPGLGDPLFSSVSLLLHMDGSGSTVVDSSGTPKTVTAYGNATQSTAQSKFGGKSAYFDGTGDYIQLSTQNQSSLQFSTQPHTVEFWFKTATTQQYTCLFYRGREGVEAAYDYVLNINNSSASAGDLALYSLGFGGAMATSTGGWNDDQWHHVAVVRDAGNVFRLYVDGVQQATRTYDMSQSHSNNSDSVIRIGKDGALSGRDYAGYVDEVRLSTVCRYPNGTSFTPSAVAFADGTSATFPVTVTGSGGGGSGLTWSSVPASATATGTAGSIAYDANYLYTAVASNTWRRAPLSTWVSPDPFFANVSLLLHADGSGGTFVDSSGSPKTVTTNGSATQSAEQSKWGGKSALLGGGTGNYLSVANSSDFAFGTGDFAIEFWLWFTQTGTQFQLFSLAGNQSGGLTPLFLEKTTGGTIAMSWSSNGSSWMTAGDGYAGGSTTLSTSAWHHVALSRTSGTFRIYIDGALDFTDASSTAAMQTGGDNPSIGVWPKYPGSGGPFYIDDFRITKGVNRSYTGSTITVPTAAFPDS